MRLVYSPCYNILIKIIIAHTVITGVPYSMLNAETKGSSKHCVVCLSFFHIRNIMFVTN